MKKYIENKGYTLLELLVSMTIISSLAFLSIHYSPKKTSDEILNKGSLKTTITKIYNIVSFSKNLGKTIDLAEGEEKNIEALFPGTKTDNATIKIRKDNICYIITGTKKTFTLELNTCFPSNFKEV